MRGNYSLAFTQKEKINSKTLFENLAQSTNFIPLIKSNYKIAGVLIQDNYSESDLTQTIKSKDVISYSFSRTKIENVKTGVRIKLDLRYFLPYI